jgi:ribonuclease E
MPKLMLINVTHSEESRVAIIDDRRLESFEIESLSREHLKGNIYKGVVHRIHPALEAAFVDIGAERDAFLPLDEICFRNLPRQAPAPTVDENGKKARRRIRDLLKPGEEILVQIAKEQFANKPPTLTTFYSLPGRYLVLLPGSDDTGISRRIEGDERQRLRKLVEDLNPPEGFGLIIRTAAGLDEETGELARDLSYLQRLWESVQEAGRHKRGPALVYREQDIVLRTIRDLFTPDIDEIHIDNEDVFLRARDFLRNVMPGKEHVLRCYRGEQPIFSAFDLESQIETVFKRRVPLRSGGTIVIDGTEALTAIDVNSGGSVRGPNPEETAFRTNMEAAAEVARQLRLRDIGGLIVVDFIDMRDNRHIHDVEQALRTGMKPDKARHETGRISRLGLMEISRQRLRPAAMATTYTTCPMCEGHGAVRTTESAALVALRKIHNRVALGDAASVRVDLPAAVALYLLNQKRDELARLEQHYGTRIQLELRDGLMAHQIELEVRERPKVERPAAIAPGGVAEADAPAAAAAAAANGHGAAAANGNGKKKRRRRGRRRGAGLRAATAIAVALATLGGVEPAAMPLGAPAPVDDGDEGDDVGLLEASDEIGADEDDSSGEDEAANEETAEAVTAAVAAPIEAKAVSTANEEGAAANRRSRGRRGGRRRRAADQRRTTATTSAAAPSAIAAPAAAAEAAAPVVVALAAEPLTAEPSAPQPDSAAADAPAKRSRARRGGTQRPTRRAKPAAADSGAGVVTDPPADAEPRPATAKAARPRRAATARPRKAKTVAAAADTGGAAAPKRRARRKSPAQ